MTSKITLEGLRSFSQQMKGGRVQYQCYSLICCVNLGENVDLCEKRAVAVKERRISQTSRRKLSRCGAGCDTAANNGGSAATKNGASGGVAVKNGSGATAGFVPPKHVLQFVVRYFLYQILLFCILGIYNMYKAYYLFYMIYKCY